MVRRCEYRENNDEDHDFGDDDSTNDRDLVDVNLQRFDPCKIHRDGFVAIIGKRRIGKTTIMENLGNALAFPRAIALCGSQGSIEHFKKFIPECYVHRGTIEILRYIIDEREKQVKANPDLPTSELETLLYIDDMACSREFMYSKEMKRLAMNGRWLRFCVVISVQYLMEMSPALRINLDYIFVTREPSRVNRRKLWENWGGCCPTLGHFELFLEKCTQKRGCLVIDCTAETTTYEDFFSHYRANPSLPAWQLGDLQFRMFHQHQRSATRAAQVAKASQFSGLASLAPGLVASR